MPFFAARSFMRLSSSTVAQLGVLLGSLPRPSADPGYPQIFLTPYRARYFKCVSFVGALWHPSFISTGLVVDVAGAANAVDPWPAASAATLEDEMNRRLFIGFIQ
jgi:hypothetical protein